MSAIDRVRSGRDRSGVPLGVRERSQEATERTPGRRATSPGRWRKARRRAVSTIIATILLLAITVTLFSVVFLAVQYFPKPPAPNVSQFAAALSYKAGGSAITAVSISHLSGPPVTGITSQDAAIYLASQNRSTTYGPFLLSQGLGGSTTWVYGQTWTCASTCTGFPSLFAPDNVTVTVTTHAGRLFQTSLQALFPGFAPYFTQAAVVPTSGSTFRSSSPSHFTVTASIVCSAACKASNPVTLNYSQFVGVATPTVALTCSPSGGSSESCSYTSSGTVVSPAASGTYFLFLVATDSLGRSDAFTLTVMVS